MRVQYDEDGCITAFLADTGELSALIDHHSKTARRRVVPGLFTHLEAGKTSSRLPLRRRLRNYTRRHEGNHLRTATTTFAIQRSGERFASDHGWLRTCHSFSFAGYFDPANTNWGALRVFNDDRIAGGGGFPLHPHQNMEILTYVLDGKLEHRDTLDSHGIVQSGGVQYLSAGTGLRHSEFNASADCELHFVQMWVLPGALNAQPTYGQVDFTTAARRGRWLAVASGETQVDAPIRLTQTASLRVSKVEQAAVPFEFAPGRLGFLFVGEGKADVRAVGTDGTAHAATLGTGDALRLADIRTLELTGAAELIFWDVPPVDFVI